MIKQLKRASKMMFQTTPFYTLMKVVFVCITGLATPFSIYALQRIFETVETSQEDAFPWTQVAFWVALYFGTQLWMLLQECFNALFQLAILKKLKEKLLPGLAEKARSIPYSCFEDKETQNTIYRLGDSPHEIVMSLFDLGLKMIQCTISILGISLVFAKISYVFVVIFIAILLPVVILDFKSTSIVRRMHQEQTFGERELKYYDELLTNKNTLQELRLTNGVRYIQSVWKNKATIVLNEQMKATVKSQLFLLLSTLVLFVFSGAMVFWAVYNLIRGNILTGVFVTIVNSIQSIYTLTYNLSDSVTALSRKRSQMDYFEKFSAIPDEERGAKRVCGEEYEIAFENVSFAYPGADKPVLSHLSFAIKPGEKVCIVGKNGAGKSTIIKLLCGLYMPLDGSIRVNGTDIREISNEEMKRVRSVVFQDYYKFYASVRENIAYADLSRLEDEEAIYDALRTGQAREFVEALPNGIDSSLGNLEEDAVDLSGGQWQKIAVSRACLGRSGFVVLDEPTAALDPLAESEMYHTFSEALKEKGYLFVSHRLASAKMAERILVIENGRIVEDGNHEALMARHGLYYDMFSSQSVWYASAQQTIERGAAGA